MPGARRRLAPVAAPIAAGVMALLGVMAVLGVMHVYQTQIRPSQQRAVLAAPLALVDLQPGLHGAVACTPTRSHARAHTAFAHTGQGA